MNKSSQNIIVEHGINRISDNFEFIERKGIGHPDTLSDHLAESLSRNYSNDTRNRFGAILHHNFDKVGLLGGKSFVALGKGYMTSPIRVLINGRVSTSFADQTIDSEGIIRDTVYNLFHTRFRGLIKPEDLEFHMNLSNGSSNGKTDEANAEKGSRKYWFEPRGLQDIHELTHLHANDTSLGCGYAPFSLTEQAVLAVEGLLNSDAYKDSHPWCGNDIKVMASRIGDKVEITMCVPQIANFVSSASEYKSNLEKVHSDIEEILKQYFGNNFTLHLNTRDNFSTGQLYLTATGSSIESGDEGLVGRGNRINGLIANNRPMSMEGANGKNPVYHVGKLYNIAAFRIAQALHRETSSPAEVYLISQTGQDLLNPWKAYVKLDKTDASIEQAAEIVRQQIALIPQITEELLRGEITLA